MNTYTYADWPSYPLVFLMPTVRLDEVRKEYLDPFDIPTDDVKCITLHMSGKKTPVKEMKAYVTEMLVDELKDARYLVVADAGYYKVLTGQDTAEGNFGYVQDCQFGPWKVVYVPSTRAIFHDPDKTRARISQGMGALLAHLAGTYEPPGTGIVRFEAYPQTDADIEAWLEKLLEMNRPLSVDIETFSLKHYKAGIGTITLCWSKHEGIAFPVDYVSHEWVDTDGKKHYGIQVRNEQRREMLRRFFIRLMQTTVYHNISFDVCALIYQLFMKDILDTEGLLAGMEVMLRNWEDTLLITYLATNTCAGNQLKLKPNSQEFSGNYSVDEEELKDITLVPLTTLLKYNLIDGLSNWYVHEKNYPKMVADDQLDIYQNLFKPSILDIVQAQLTGLPINMEQVKWVKQVLQAVEADARTRLADSDVVKQFTYQLQEQHVAKRNSELKKKRITLDDEETKAVSFNPNSSQQLQELLYEMLGFKVIDLTDSKLPSTKSEVLEKLLNHTEDPRVRGFLRALIDHKSVVKIQEFVEVFETAELGPDGWYYLFGSFRLGGTVSGRLSSNSPNLQNLPANVEMMLAVTFLTMFPELKKYFKKGMLHLGKLIKSCISAASGWVFTGLDFMSLEDKISALTTKDPNKLKVYTDGYDGHSLRAFSYFGDQMPDIVDTVESINSIQDKYKPLRQDSKAPTFALTYQGTYHTLMKNCGFSEEKAKMVESRYQDLYQVSIEYIRDKLAKASKDGYVTAAFGLRVRTPLLAQTIRGARKTPYEAEAEGRSSGNALGQSWCLLTNRASVEFMRKVRSSKYRFKIRPSVFIHDALYHIMEDDPEVILWANEHLREAVRWQEHPDIAHDQVKLDGAMSLFYPNWSNEIELPYKADEATLRQVVREAMEKTK